MPSKNFLQNIHHNSKQTKIQNRFQILTAEDVLQILKKVKYGINLITDNEFLFKLID